MQMLRFAASSYSSSASSASASAFSSSFLELVFQVPLSLVWIGGSARLGGFEHLALWRVNGKPHPNHQLEGTDGTREKIGGNPKI